jgi:hypothetical protein
MQVELLDRRAWKTRIELANVISWVPGYLPQPSPPPQRVGVPRPIACEMLHSTERRVA